MGRNDRAGEQASGFFLTAEFVEIIDGATQTFPSGATLRGERALVSEPSGLLDEQADAVEDLGLFGGNPAACECAGQGAKSALAGPGGRVAGGEGSKCVKEIVLAGATRSKCAVGVAEAVITGMSGLGTAATVLEGEQAEGGFLGVIASRGHEGIIP